MSTLDEIWVEDRLGRQDDATYIEAFLTNRIAERQAVGQTASHVLNINAPWGTGKSFS